MKDDLDTFEAACRAADGEATVDNHLSEPDEIARLAKLPKLEYDRQRDEAAARLGVRVATLDKRVREERSAADDGAATLPHWKVEPAPMPIEGAKLLDGLRQVFRRYIVLPKGADIALPLWVLHAWTFDSGEISPFIVLVSPVKRCGKTSVLILLYYLTPRSELASNISPSAIFRYIEEMRPTLLIDEADAFVKDNEELRGILNSGHTKAAANVIRNIEINGEHKPRRFSTWAPKAIATIRSLADTLEDRAVIVQLQRKPPGAKVERLRKRDNEWFAALRSHAARWSADNAAHLADPDPQIPNALNDRAADNWRPLIAIADLAGGEWPQLARQACLTLSGEAQEESLGVMLLADCRAAFGDDDMIRSADLVTRLSADPERPWAEYNRGGKPITQRQVARLLRAFSIISVNVRPEIGPQGKGYRRTDFEEAWATYCPVKTPSRVQGGLSIRPNVPRPVKSGQVDGFASVPEAPWDGSKNGKLSYSHAGLDAWTDKKGGKGSPDDLATPEAPECSNTATAGNGHRDADVTAPDEGSLNPEVRDGDPRDCGPMPECLRRAPLDRRPGGRGSYDQASKGSGTSPVCAVCKEPEPPPNQVAIDGLNVWLHRECEAAYLASLADDSSPTLAEPAARTNGAQHQAATDAVANVPGQAEKAPPAVVDEADPAQPDQPVSTPAVTDVADPADPVPPAPVSTPNPVPARPMLPGDRRRAEIRARNQEAVERENAKMRAGLH